LKPEQIVEVRKMVLSGRKSAADAARIFGVHPATISRLLAQQQQVHDGPTRRRRAQ
jgi:transposase-like protein